jgi:hypothetical protein
LTYALTRAAAVRSRVFQRSLGDGGLFVTGTTRNGQTLWSPALVTAFAPNFLSNQGVMAYIGVSRRCEQPVMDVEIPFER